MLEPEITPEAFAQQRQQPNSPLLLDVRESWEYQTANLPNSLLMPMGEVSSRAHTELDPDAPIVVMCHHGARSLNVALWLRDQGFTHAQSLAGGIDAWSRVHRPARAPLLRYAVNPALLSTYTTIYAMTTISPHPIEPLG